MGAGGGLRSLVLAMKLPFPSRGGGDLRTAQTVDALARLGPVEVVAPAGRDPAAEPPLAWLRDPLGHPAERWFTRADAEEVARIGRELKPHVAVLEMLWLHRYIDVVRELGCKLVLNAHNLEGSMYEELAAARGDAASAKAAERARAIESVAFTAVDQVWLCSERDAARVETAGLRDGGLAVVPNAVDVSRYEHLERDEEPATLLYPANYAYPPNRTAARRLLEIFPAFAERVRDARLVLLGDRPTADMREASARDARIEVTGPVDDSLPFLASATVMPVPLVEGGGTRLKVLEAFAAGLPVVSTAKGVEGLDVVAGEHYVAAESNDDFVSALAHLCSDRAARVRLTDRGRQLVRERYSWDAARVAIADALKELGVL
ncbi:MAG: glycosyltransferase family 4 protein [Thermoleophilaceae bacterium]